MHPLPLPAAAAASALLLVAPVAVHAAPADAAVPKSPLLAKKTVQTKAVFSVMNQASGEYTPFFDVAVTVDARDGTRKYRIDATPLAAKGKPVSFYFSDGAKQYEYNSLNGKYRIADAPAAGQRPMSQLAAMAGLDLLLSPGAPPRPGIERTLAQDTLDGKKAVTITDREPARKTNDGKEMRAFVRVWFDASTGLPLRKLEGATIDGVERPNLNLVFTSWAFDGPVAPATFAWSVPPSSEEDTGPKLLAVGTAAPDFSAVTPDGKTVRLSDYKGKVVVLDFWATWCGPCIRSMPHLESVYRRVKGRDDVTVLAVCVWDEKEPYDGWVAANVGTKYTFPVAFDASGRGEKSMPSSLFKVEGIPAQFVIGKDGRVAAAFTGFTQGDRRLEAALQRLGIPVAPAEPAATAGPAASPSGAGR